jgi:hypothetical protein
MCFGSEGCVLVPRSSGTLVATWAWPTWVVSQRHVLEAVFVLLESSSPSRRIFIGSHSLPPSPVRRIGPSLICSHVVWSLSTLNLIKSGIRQPRGRGNQSNSGSYGILDKLVLPMSTPRLVFTKLAKSSLNLLISTQL